MRAPRIIPDVTLQTIGDKTVIVVEISPGKMRPYFIKSKGILDGTFVRVSGTTRHVADYMLKELILEGQNRYYDSEPCKGIMATKEDIEKLCRDLKAVALRNSLTDAEKAKVKDVTENILLSWGVLAEKDETIASGIRNLIGDKLRQLETEKSSAVKSMEDSTKAVKEGRTLKRQLEAGLVQYGIDMLASEKKKQDAERERMAENQKALDDRYAEAMTLEGYGEYRGIREKLHKAEQSLLDLEKNGDELHGQYREAGGRLKFLWKRRSRRPLQREISFGKRWTSLKTRKK